MSERTGTAMLVVLLLVVCGSLVYLDWRRQGEVDNLHARLDALDGRLVGNASDLGTAHTVVTPKLPGEPTVERILHADDDRTLADIARGNA